MNTAISTILNLAAIAALAFVMGVAMNAGWNANEKAECVRWAEQASEFEGFYLTQAESAQCAHHGIKVDAPVK